jgi:hypothetical protein
VRYFEYPIWITLRLACIALAAPHIYPAWPKPRPIGPLVATAMLLAVIAVALTLASGVLLIPTGVIGADAFAFCRW